jgi:hypothetical protein
MPVSLPSRIGKSDHWLADLSREAGEPPLSVAKVMSEAPTPALALSAPLRFGGGTKGVAVPLLTHDGARYIAHVLPLTSEARRGAGTR